MSWINGDRFNEILSSSFRSNIKLRVEVKTIDRTLCSAFLCSSQRFQPVDGKILNLSLCVCVYVDVLEFRRTPILITCTIVPGSLNDR